MPNWCSNSVTFIHNDPEQIKRLEKAGAEGKLFTEFLPCPKELLEGSAPATGDIVDHNVTKYGAPDWYTWCLNNWGTKWDVEADSDNINNIDPNTTSVFFDTAWSPPVEFYQYMVDNGWSIYATYYEPGMAFCGSWNNGDDDQIEITGDSEWVLENVPADIDEAFQISYNMESWEQDNSDEDEEETEDETEDEEK
jgi:hypothetical protein